MSESSAAAPGPKESADPAGSTSHGDNGQATAPAAQSTSGSSPEAAEGAAEGEAPPPKTARTLIAVLAALCVVLFWWVGVWLDIPQERGFGPSLLQQSGAAKVLAVVVAALLVLGCAIAGHLIAGRRWLYAGPFIAATGLAGWSLRGGASRYAYFHAADAGHGRTVFLLLALELALLSAVVGLIWYALASAARAALALQAENDVEPAPAAQPGAGIAGRLQGLAFQVLLTAVAVWIFARSDDIKQVLAAVFLGCFVGASLTEHFFAKEDLEAWYWLGPALVGVLGYLLNDYTNAANAPAVTGHLSGLFAPLSRPLPLDYASAGMVGALLGFWTGGEHPEIAAGTLLVHPRFLMHSAARAARAARTPPGKRMMDQR